VAGEKGKGGEMQPCWLLVCKTGHSVPASALKNAHELLMWTTLTQGYQQGEPREMSCSAGLAVLSASLSTSETEVRLVGDGRLQAKKQRPQSCGHAWPRQSSPNSSRNS
jgi:hypothetical protein